MRYGRFKRRVAGSCGVKTLAALFAAVQLQAAPTPLVFDDAAASGEVDLVGDGTREFITSSARPVKLKDGCVYGFEYSARSVGRGVVFCGTKSARVDRHAPDAVWYEYRQAFVTEGEHGGTSDNVFFYGLYRGKGEFSYKDGKFLELRPGYSDFSGISLGHGESIWRNTYRFDTLMRSFARNHSRPLLRYRKASFNSSCWNVNAGSDVVYAHEVAGRRFMDAAVNVDVSYSRNTGPMLVQASLDGAEWRTVASVSNKCSSKASVPADMFPAKRLYIRLFGGSGCSLQVSHYGLECRVDGDPVVAYGATRYFDAETGAFYDEVKQPVFVDGISPANAWRLPSLSGAALWGAVEDVKVFRTTPVPTAEAKALSVSLAGNESESVQLVVTPKEDVRDVRVVASDLVMEASGSSGGARLGASAVKVGRLAYLRVQYPTDETGAIGDWPDPILPQEDGDEFPVAAGDGQPFWITVKTPKGLPKGVYRGALEVVVSYAGGRKERAAVPFEVEVYGFDLPDMMSCATAAGFNASSVADFHAVKFGSAEHAAVVEKYVQLISDYRFSVYRWGKGEGFKVKWKNAGDPAVAEPQFDWAEFDDAHAEMYGRFHINAFKIPVGGLGKCFHNKFEPGSICGVSQTNALYQTLMAKYLGGIERHLREKGWLDISYVYLFDEPHPSVFGMVNEVANTVKAHAPGLRRMASASPSKEMWGVDLWIPRLDILHSPDYADARARGDHFWWYIACGPRAPYPTSFIDHDGCELRTWLWMTWGRNIAGAHVWETTCWTRAPRYPDPLAPQNPYVDPMGWSNTGGMWGNGDGRFVYPPPAAAVSPRAKDRKPVLDGPNPSYRLAILRDGVEDYEYFAILKRLDPSNPLLKVPADVFESERRFSRDPSFMRIHRAKLAREIERLGGDTLRLPPPATCVAARPGGKDGFRVLDAGGRRVAVNGFDDMIQETLWRVENGELDGVDAEAVALVLGTNNTGCEPADMAAGVRKVVDAIRGRRPGMPVLLYASFPCRLTWRSLRNKAANALYAGIADGKGVFFRDVNDRLPLNLFPDGVHPNDKAVAVWLADIAAWLASRK